MVRQACPEGAVHPREPQDERRVEGLTTNSCFSGRDRMNSKTVWNVADRKWVQFILLIGFCVVVYFANLNRWDLWSPDEPRYAEVAREMVTGGDWILMHYDGRAYSDKPPLFFWLLGLSSYLWQGFSSFSVRFVPALFGTLTVLLTFLLGQRVFDSKTGLLSGLILATGFEFAYLSTRANIDTTLTFFTTASLFCFFKWYSNHPPRPLGERVGAPPSPLTLRASEGKQLARRSFNVRGGLWRRTVRGALWIYGFYIGMALATLTKGPVGILLPLLTSLIYLSIQKEWKTIKEMRPLTGMALFFLIVLSWYLPAVWKGGESYLKETLVTHSINRYSTGWAKGRPIYYYLYIFPSSFLPWFIFLPSAIIHAYSKEIVRKRKEVLFLMTWFAVIFIFFSLSRGKRSLYLLPLYPAVSLLIGKTWNDFISDTYSTLKKAWVSLPLFGLTGLLFLFGVIIVLSPWIHGSIWKRIPASIYSHLPTISIGLFLVGCSLFLFVLIQSQYRRAVFVILVSMLGIGFFYTTRVVFPMVNPYKSARFLSQEITSRIKPGDKIGVYGRISVAPYNFYTGVVPITELNTPKELLGFLKSSNRVFCLISFNEFQKLQSQDGEVKIHMLARRQVGDQDSSLISNQ